MSESHVVKPGEHLPRIAAAAGFHDASIIWDHAKNADLKKQRHPCVLAPDDVVFIPDKKPKTFTLASGNEHFFEIPRLAIHLSLALYDASARPIANTDCKLACKGDEFALKTDGSGKIDHEIPIDTDVCKLTILDTEIQVLVGHLTPIEETPGVRARLNNLGYHAGTGDDEDLPEDEDLELRSAIEEFQCDQGLKTTGEVDDTTRAKLKTVHGY